MALQTQSRPIRGVLRDYLALTKGRQTALLVFTGVGAYALSTTSPLVLGDMMIVGLALFLSISGCTALNMILDHDIDARMGRTASRPLPAGRLLRSESLAFGLALSTVGLALSFSLNTIFGLIVSLGFVFDLLVYTLWLKRVTPFAILVGGIAGGMPAFAGRSLAIGHIDPIGLLFAAIILLWIPTHILTLGIKYQHDYARAGVPIWPSIYGIQSTRLVIAGTSLGNALLLIACAIILRIHPLTMGCLFAVSGSLVVMSIIQLFRPTEARNWALFKLASVQMALSIMLLLIGVRL